MEGTSKYKPVSCGRDLSCASELPAVLETAGHDGSVKLNVLHSLLLHVYTTPYCILLSRFDFVSTYLVNPRYKRDLIKRKGYHGDKSTYEPLTRNDLIMSSSGTTKQETYVIIIRHFNASYYRLDEPHRC